MSSKGQSNKTANELIELYPENPLITRTIQMFVDMHDKPHSHHWHQVICPKNGMLRTRTTLKDYFVPSNRAVMIPAETVHESWAISDVKFIGIYLNPEFINWPYKTCRIIEISPLLRELINYIIQLELFTKLNHHELRLLKVFSDQLLIQNEVHLDLLLPTDKRLLKISDQLISNPATNLSLSDWAKSVGATERTISRNFEKQTGLTFSKWRQRLRLISSLRDLEKKRSINEVSYRVGYSSPSAFIQSFKKEFQITPQQYFNRP